MRKNSGRIGLARKILLDASQMAVETGEYAISVKCKTKAHAFGLRQSCYAYQRAWATQIQEDAIMDGLDPDIVLHETAMKATWPSASIGYECVKNEHWLVIRFGRIGTDPDWDTLIRERMIAGLPPKPKRETLNSDELFKLISEDEQ